MKKLPKDKLARPSTDELLELIRLCESADTKDGIIFREIIGKSLNLFDSIDLDLAREYQTAVSTIHRWANGISSPHPLLRRDVYNTIIASAEIKIVEKLSGIEK